jgi:hypothetical protein
MSEVRPRRWGRIAAVVAILVFTATAIALRTDIGARLAPSWLRWATGSSPGPAATLARVVPDSVRIKVEVLNATDTRGLARLAMFALRDAGFDVVYFGNTSERHDSTIVRDRSGHAQWAELARGVMAPAAVETRADSGRLVDLTVLIGARWRPPTEPFRP